MKLNFLNILDSAVFFRIMVFPNNKIAGNKAISIQVHWIGCSFFFIIVPKCKSK